MINIIKKILVLTLITSLITAATVSAETITSNYDLNSSLESSYDVEDVDLSDMSANTLIPENINEVNYNVIDRSLNENFENVKPTSKRASRASNLNSDPNDAYLIEHSDVYNGIMSANGEFRWYAFMLEETSKVSIILQMVNTMDADLYLFELDPSYQLQLLGGSAQAGYGTEETYNGILNPGIYYIAASNYDGNGLFALAFYESRMDADYEVNDTSETATAYTIDSNITAVLDNPRDIDYYKVTLNKNAVISSELTVPGGADYQLVYAGGSGGSRINSRLLSLSSGTHYFAVYSPQGNYSNTSAYTAKINMVGAAANDPDAVFYALDENSKVVFQFNAEGTKYYVNGNRINFSYEYKKNISNSAGTQNYDISVENYSDNKVVLFQSQGLANPGLQQRIPELARYHRSTFTGKSLERVLTLSVYNTNRKFYFIHNVCSGSYAGNTFWEDLNFVNLFIDPDTGKVIDIEYFNYYYEIGNHSVTYTRPYTMKYFYPYYNGREPVGGDS